MKVNSKNEYIKDLKLRLVLSQNKNLEKLMEQAKNELNIHLSKTATIKIAVNEFIENIESNDDLKNILEKYQYI